MEQKYKKYPQDKYDEWFEDALDHLTDGFQGSFVELYTALAIFASQKAAISHDYEVEEIENAVDCDHCVQVVQLNGKLREIQRQVDSVVGRKTE